MNKLQLKIIKIQVENQIKKMSSIEVLSIFFDLNIKISLPIDIKRAKEILNIVLQLKKIEQVKKCRRLEVLRYINKELG